MGILEAECLQCGEIFVPNDEEDTTHGEHQDGTPCGGQGIITGEWVAPPRKETRPVTSIPAVKQITQFTYTKLDGERETVMVRPGAGTQTDACGLYYTPFEDDSNLPVSILIPWHRMVEVFYQ